jgi:hypothetical protein
MNQPDSAQALVDHWLTQIVGLRAWEPSVGVGSFLTIEFGDTRITSTGLTVGAFHIWIYGALWEIRDRKRIIATSSDARVEMVAGAQALDGLLVQGFEFDRERMTLNLRFGPEVELAVTPFGDLDMEEWLLYLNDGNVITAGPGDTVTHESASYSQPLTDGQDGAMRPHNG